MILDAYGRELRRAIGFKPYLKLVRTPEPMSDAISSATVECEEAEVFEERAEEDRGKP